MTTSEPQLAGAPRKGDLIAGKYRVEEVLGKGGMGVVVAAEHVVLHQRVAIKFLLPMAAEMPDAVERFLREARAGSAIQSEHVTRVLDVGALENGAPYLVMELLAGRDLGATLKERGALPIPEAVALVLQACEALAEAHAQGIIHRDLKPSNLFVAARPDGSPLVKILDFGLAKALGDEGGAGRDVGLTATSAVIGSPHYMSPEQFRGLKHVDARTDVWAMGVVLYAALSGKRPFDGDTYPEICMSVAAESPAPLVEHNPAIPAELDAAILRCLEKDKTKRTQSVTELAIAVAPFGGASAALSAERIQKILPLSSADRASGTFAAAPESSVTTEPARSAPGDRAPTRVGKTEPDTASSFSGTQKPPARRESARSPIFIGAAGLALGAALALSFVIGRASPSAPAASIRPATDEAPRQAPAADLKAPTISASAQATPAPTASAAVSAPPAASSASSSAAARPSAPPKPASSAAPKPKSKPSSTDLEF